MPRRAYHIGIGPASHSGVDYLPDHPPAGLICFWAGHANDADGGGYDFKTALEPGFRNDFVRLHADWFLPLLERLARGESVDIAEMNRACQAATGHPLTFTLLDD